MTRIINLSHADFRAAYAEIRSTFIPISGKATFQDAKKIVNYRCVADIFTTVPDILLKHNIFWQLTLEEQFLPKDLYEEITLDGEVRSTRAPRRKYIGKFRGQLISLVDNSILFEDIIFDTIDVLDGYDSGYAKAYSCANRDWLRNLFGIPSSDNNVERGNQVPKSMNKTEEMNIKLNLIKSLKKKITEANQPDEVITISNGFLSHLKNLSLELTAEEWQDCENFHISKIDFLNKPLEKDTAVKSA